MATLKESELNEKIDSQVASAVEKTLSKLLGDTEKSLGEYAKTS